MLGISRVAVSRCSRALGRSRSSLVDTHEMFLNLVKDHGEGSIDLTNHGAYAELVINNPSKRNAISGKMMFEFANIIDSLAPVSCSEVKNGYVGVLLRGTGKDAFSAGADLTLVKEIVNTPVKGGLMSMFMTDALNRLYQSNLISVCVLNGPALGGGSEISTSCDFRVMPTDDKVFVQFVHAKIGASPGWGGAYRLTKMVGRREAIRMIGTSPRVAALEAQAINFADALVQPYTDHTVSPDDHFRAAGVQFLQPYLDMQFPGSVRAVKQAIAAADELDTEAARCVELNMFKQRWGGSDNKTALTKK